MANTSPVAPRVHSGSTRASEESKSTETAAAKPIVERKVVIIGSGPSGCTAAIYTGRALLNPLVIAGYNAGGQLMLTSDVENFPGYTIAPSGPELIFDLMSQAEKFGAEYWKTECKSVDFTQHPFRLELHNATVMAKSVILSTGADSIWLGSEDEDKYKGMGISTCATCDGFMFREKNVVVIGGGDSAMEEANFLTRFANSVTLIHRRDSFRASKLMLQRVQQNKKIKLATHRQVVKWHGEKGVLSGATLVSTETGETEEIQCDGAFIAIGHKPNTKFLNDGVALDKDGYILHESNTMTNVPGVFACGDVVDRRYKQAITAAGQGCQAAIDAEKWLEELTSSVEH